jgi:hypothetical protein
MIFRPARFDRYQPGLRITRADVAASPGDQAVFGQFQVQLPQLLFELFEHKNLLRLRQRDELRNLCHSERSEESRCITMRFSVRCFTSFNMTMLRNVITT